MLTPRSNLEFRWESCFTLYSLNSFAKPIEPNYFHFSTMKLLSLFTKKQMAQRSQTFAQGTKKMKWQNWGLKLCDVIIRQLESYFKILVFRIIILKERQMKNLGKAHSIILSRFKSKRKKSPVLFKESEFCFLLF